MADQKVKIIFEVDGVEQVVNSIEDYKKAMKEAGSATENAEQKQGFFAKRLDEFKDKLNDIKSSFGDLGKGFTLLKDGLSKVGQGFGLSGKAANVFGKVTASAIAMTGIGLLVPLVISLVNYFKNLEGGARALQKVMSGLGAIISNTGKALKLLVSGDFSGAFNTLKNAVTEATEAVDQQFDAEKKLADFRKKSIVENAKLNQTIEAQKKILEDGTLSVETRLAALDKVNAATKQLQQNQIEETRLTLESAKAQLTLANNYEERRQKEIEIAELQGQLIEQQTALQGIEYDAAKVAREIRAQAAADAKAKADEEAAAAKEAADKKIEQEKYVSETLRQLRVDSIDDERQKQFESLDLARQKAIAELELNNATKDELAEAEKLYQAQIAQLKEDYRQEDLDKEKDAAKIKKDLADQEKAEALAVANAKLGIASNAFATLSQLVGEQSVIGKASSVASATIDTYAAANNALKTTPLPPPFPQIAAAATIAAGLVNVRSILKTETPGTSSGSVSVPSISVPPAINPDITQIDNIQGLQNAGATIGLDQEKPVRAYVVATEVSSAQEANKRIDDLARL